MASSPESSIPTLPSLPTTGGRLQGIKGGMTYGATDEYGVNAVDGRMDYHDLHATLLHIFGLDHEKLTYRYAGRDFRLTDVAGNVLQDILS